MKSVLFIFLFMVSAAVTFYALFAGLAFFFIGGLLCVAASLLLIIGDLSQHN